MASVDIEPYVRFEAAQTHPTVRGWLAAERIKDNLRQDLGQELTQRTEATRAAQYRKRCPVDGTTEADYVLREVDLGRDGRVLAGIHFMNLNVERPFVGVLARTQPVADRGAVHRVGQRLRQAFSAFAPRCLQVWHAPRDRGLGDARGTRVDVLVMAGRLGELRSRPAPEAPVPLALDPCKASDIYPAYCATFERFLAAQPNWRDRIHIESEESLREAETDGVLCRALVAGEPAGFFAAVPRRERALSGYVILEEILDAPFRGRGLAPALQRMLYDQLAAEPGTQLFGHINGANLPSLGTARRVGREEVYRTVFVPFGETSALPRGFDGHV